LWLTTPLSALVLRAEIDQMPTAGAVLDDLLAKTNR
jgi:hypothetical protein